MGSSGSPRKRGMTFCLALAREVGLPAASSEVRRFGEQRVIVVERYDRVVTDSLADGATTMARARQLRALAISQPILRLHQADLCQALGAPGGMAVAQVAEGDARLVVEATGGLLERPGVVAADPAGSGPSRRWDR